MILNKKCLHWFDWWTKKKEKKYVKEDEGTDESNYDIDIDIWDFGKKMQNTFKSY